MRDSGRAASSVTRALITELEREHIAGENSDDQRYQAVSRVRARVRDQLVKDIEVLAKHHPDLLAEVRAVVCDG